MRPTIIHKCVIFILFTVFAGVIIASDSPTKVGQKTRQYHQNCDLACFECLSCEWQEKRDSLLITESWGKDDAWVFHVRRCVIRGDDTLSVELMRIKDADTAIYLIYDTPKIGTARFVLIASDSMRFIFESLNDALPGRIIYSYKYPNSSLRVEIQGEIFNALHSPYSSYYYPSHR
jgi:hypothetical protein